MKPMRVGAGEYAPDLDDLMDKANDMLEKLERDDSHMQDVRGVEAVRPSHYWTNQDLPEDNIESVSKKSPSAENVNLLDANPHQTGSTVRVHENNAGGPAHPTEALTKSIKGILKADKCPTCGSKLQKAGAVCKDVECAEKMSKGPLDALMGGGDEPPMDDDSPMSPMDDDDSSDESAEGLASRIKSMVDKLADMNDDEDEDEPPEMSSPEEDM
tara:strand:+ start:71 stop:712 length:642 start_codon:yes stop_codon:yes gene_type:complete